MASLRLLSAALFAPLALAGLSVCDANASVSPDEAITETAEYVTDVSIPMVQYTWDPMAGDPEVSAEMGGPGFTGEGWKTNMEFPALGAAEAVKGGDIRMYLPSWPVTLRLQGQNWNASFNYSASSLCTESLLTQHPATLEHIPSLATHWHISEDGSTFRFRINPKARWSDGKKVTSADVIATYQLVMDESILFPSNQMTYGKFEEPVALSKYIIEVKTKQTSWRNFMYFAGLSIMPAHQISIPGSEYLEIYQNKFTAVTGPYTLAAATLVRNKFIQLERRKDWWDKDNPAWQGLWNFDTYSFSVVRKPDLAFEKAKKGELDYFPPPRAQWWVEELVPKKVSAIKRGLLQKRKFYNHSPKGLSGLALNSTREPLNDVRLRKALAMLRDRPVLIDKLFFNEYRPLSSYWEGGDYHNRDNAMVTYDPFGAVELLTEAGWGQKNDSGIRVKDGQPLSFQLMYSSDLSEANLTFFKGDCRRAGIDIELKKFDSASFSKNMKARTYDIASTGWGGLTFPNPESSFSSELAEKTNNNNITGFANKRVDELLKAYDVEFDIPTRAAIIREIDGIIFNEHPYVLDWYNPSQRVIYWNKFSMPKWGVSRFSNTSDMMHTWWIDPQKEAALEAAKRDKTIQLETAPIQHHFWDAWMKSQSSL